MRFIVVGCRGRRHLGVSLEVFLLAVVWLAGLGADVFDLSTRRFRRVITG